METIKDQLNKTNSYLSINTYEKACEILNLAPGNLPDVSLIPEKFRKSIIAAHKLLFIFSAINCQWEPDWDDLYEKKYYPSFEVTPGGLGWLTVKYVIQSTQFPTQLLTNSQDKAWFIGSQFKKLYQDYLLF